MKEREYFSFDEAQAKVGRRIKTLVEWSGVPKDTTGQVIRFDPAGQTKPPFGEARETFDVAIQWDLPRAQPLAELVIPGDAPNNPYIHIRTGKPLVDWFTKSEYEEYLEELDENA
jgi:hypothetical protein